MVADFTVDPTRFARGGPYLGRAAVGGPARPAVVLTGDESYDTRTYEELLLRPPRPSSAWSAGERSGSSPGSRPPKPFAPSC